VKKEYVEEDDPVSLNVGKLFMVIYLLYIDFFIIYLKSKSGVGSGDRTGLGAF
jgi:hypothetical protein